MNFEYCDSDIYSVDDSNYLFDCYSFEIIKLAKEHVQTARELISDPKKFSLKKASPDFIAPIIMAIQNGHFFRKFQVGNVSAELTRMTPIFSFTPTHKCNLACTYCFAKSGNNYHDVQKELDITTIDNMISFMNNRFATNPKIRVEFVGGGEPLMHKESLKHIISSLKSVGEKDGKQYSVQVITNGTLLDETIIRWIDENNLKLGISIDGNKDIQNSQRIYKNGKGTYDIVVNNIKKIKRMNNISSITKDIWVVSVLTTHCKSIYDIIEHHNSIGIKSLEIRVARGSENDINLLNENTLPYFKQLYYELMCNLLNDIKNEKYDKLIAIANNYDTFGKLIKRLINKEKVIYRCGAGKWKYACTANGDVYPCDSFVGNKDFIITNVNSGYINNDIILNFTDTNVQSNYPCFNCNCRYLCGGDCYYNAYINNQDIKNSNTCFCKLNKYLCALAIHLVYELQCSSGCFHKVKSLLKVRELMSI